jgi:uncharacterized protein involved in response to NO
LDVPLASLIFFVLAAVVSRFAPVDPQFHHHRWALISIALAIASFILQVFFYARDLVPKNPEAGNRDRT